MVLKPDYFIKSDGGRSKSLRPKQTNDCTVIATSLILNIDYDIAYDALARLGRKSSQGFFFPTGTHYRKNGRILGNEFVWTALQAVKDEPRENVWTFLKKYDTGRYVIRLSGHVITCIDGKVYDTAHPDMYKCVYGYWKLKNV